MRNSVSPLNVRKVFSAKNTYRLLAMSSSPFSQLKSIQFLDAKTFSNAQVQSHRNIWRVFWLFNCLTLTLPETLIFLFLFFFAALIQKILLHFQYRMKNWKNLERNSCPNSFYFIPRSKKIWIEIYTCFRPFFQNFVHHFDFQISKATILNRVALETL